MKRATADGEPGEDRRIITASPWVSDRLYDRTVRGPWSVSALKVNADAVPAITRSRQIRTILRTVVRAIGNALSSG